MIRLELSAGIGRITIARPEKRNAFDGAMLAAIGQAVADWADEPTCRVIVLGADGPMFCAGADIGWMAEQAMGGPDANRDGARALGAVFHAIAGSRKPVVGRIQGAARGGGVGLAAACDICIASTDASFALTEVRLGLLPAVISPFVVERLGPSQARALFMTGDAISGAEAYRLGLAHHLVAPADLDAKVAEVAQSLVAGGPEALLACKRLVAEVAFRNPKEVFELTVDAISQRRASPEAQEGMMAFLERRPASWIPSPK